MKAILILSLLLVTGCASGPNAMWKPFQRSTNVVEAVVEIPATTNVVEKPALLDTNGTILAPATIIEVVTPQRFLTNFVTNVSVEVNPTWQKGISGAQTVNSMANPTPTAPLVNLGLGALATALGWWARLQTRKANKNMDLLETVITGVEEANKPDVKETISKIAKQWGNSKDLEAQVQRVTKS